MVAVSTTCVGQLASPARNVSLRHPTDATAAARFLDQSSFGPTSEAISLVQSRGLGAYLEEQLALPPTLMTQFSLPVPTPCDSAETCWGAVWWKSTLTAPDHLRQRVAFALGHIFVVSTLSVGGYAMVPYYNILLRDAFGDWRTLMQDIALSPVMGLYLNMVNSAKAAPGQIANENFARESMQLFGTGTMLLNPDGTEQRGPNGSPKPVYTQAQVQDFARAFTGWTFASEDGSKPSGFTGEGGTFSRPMVAVEREHDQDAKRLLGDRVLPAGQTAEQDLTQALDNIFASANLPPFLCRQLIQHLVTSNPSSAYVARVTAVFKDDGSGKRGNLKAVITAILMDKEARAGDIQPNLDAGHLRESLLLATGIMRALHYEKAVEPGPYAFWTISWTSGTAGETPMQAPSVFYYYSPFYQLPGTNRTAPEFAMESVAGISGRKVMVDQLLNGRVAHTHFDLAADREILRRAADPRVLVDEFDLLFMHSQMPAPMKQLLVTTIAPLRDPLQRVRMGLYLTLTSSQYMVLH